MTDPALRDRFARLVRATPVDLGRAALLLAAQARPTTADHDITQGLRTLDQLAGSLPEAGPAPDRLRHVLDAFHGDADEYGLIGASMLPRVLQRRRGLPILLSTVWLEVAKRAEIPAYGIGLPGHFIVGLGDPDGYHDLVDPFRGGRTLQPRDLRPLAGRTVGPHGLRPWEPIEILQRILNNVRAWADRPERLPTRRWAIELALTLPRHPLDLRRQYGAVMVQLGGFQEGALALEQYADEVERVDADAARVARSQARQAKARLN